MTTKQQPDPSHDHQTTTIHDHGALFKYKRTHMQDLRRVHFRIESAHDQKPQKNAHGKHQKKKTERKRMANKEFSTRFFLSESVRKVPRVQNIKKCGWCRGCQTVEKQLLFREAVLRACADTSLSVVEACTTIGLNTLWRPSRAQSV